MRNRGKKGREFDKAVSIASMICLQVKATGAAPDCARRKALRHLSALQAGFSFVELSINGSLCIASQEHEVY
jgi:hypothetical protein